METKVKSNSIITTTVTTDGNLQFTVLGAGTLTLNIKSVHERIMARAALHGLKQRVSDAAAIPFDEKLNRRATPAEKFDAMKSIVDHYNSGSADWSPKRSERIGSDETMLSRALEELYPAKGADVIRAYVTKLSRDERKALSLKPEIKALIDGYNSESVATIDTDELLAGL